MTGLEGGGVVDDKSLRVDSRVSADKGLWKVSEGVDWGEGGVALISISKGGMSERSGSPSVSSKFVGLYIGSEGMSVRPGPSLSSQFVGLGTGSEGLS